MLWEYSNTDFYAILEGEATGLVGTVAVRVVDPALLPSNPAHIIVARHTTDIEEIAPGTYAAKLNISRIGGLLIIWDAGDPSSPADTFSEDLEIQQSPLTPSGSGGPGPVLGPAQSWIDGTDVAACCNANIGSDMTVLDRVAVEASMVLYEISGRMFPGINQRKVRPCRQTCACFGQSVAAGLGPWYWTSASYGGASGWYNECGDSRGCGTSSVVKLAGYPVTEITEVRIDGLVVDPAGYRLDDWRNLTRMADPGPPVVDMYWPTCQDMSLNDNQPGTFSVSYLWGVNPPAVGLSAASQLACQLWLSCNGGDCQLPAGVTQIQRQGVTVQRGLLVNFLDPTKPTGLVAIDAFLRAYGTGSRRRSAVWSPDVQAYARRLG